MAEKNAIALTPFEKEQFEIQKKILEYKLSPEANIVGTIYKNPNLIYEIDLTLADFHHNQWKVFFKIAYDMIFVEKANVLLDDCTIGLYLRKHEKLKKKYDEYGGFEAILNTTTYIKEENFFSYISELKKWQTVFQLSKDGCLIDKKKLSEYADMSLDEIYDDFEVLLNHTFVSVSENVKSYNVFEGMNEFIDELNSCKDVGMPFYNANLLTETTGGFNLNGNIYGLGGTSGTGKSTMAFNYIVPSAIENDLPVVFIINEEDERKFKKELLVWVANNIFKEELHKHVLRDGKFTDEVLSLLRKCAKWIEDKKDKHILTVIPLERYSVNVAIKIVRKYSSAFGVKLFVLDTLKESADSKSDEIFRSMMRDMVKLYDVVKPTCKNVGLLVTYQLGKQALKIRHLTNNEIGQAKSIIDVMSVNIMIRRPYDDEYEDGKRELKCYKLDGINHKTKIPFKLNRDKNYMIVFVTKNRFGETDAKQIVAECDLSTDVYKEIGYCHVPQDF